MTACCAVRTDRVFTVGAVEVVAARLDAQPATVRALAAWLCDKEQRRAARIRLDRERRRFIVARALLRELLAKRVGVLPEAVEFVYGANGKPALARPFADAGWRFNVSHCDELAVYGFSRAGDIGIDTEAIRAVPEADQIAARFFSSREHDAYRALPPQERSLGFLSCWTRKEAFVKALGEGLHAGLKQFDVSLGREPARLLRLDTTLGDARDWSLESFSPVPGFIAALATRRA
jgi:4'-phosphopantetheinyl transferase